MSPVAAALAAGLHVATALALFLASPLNRPDVDVDDGKAIEVTIEQPKPPEEPPVQEAAKPQPQPTPLPQPAAQPAPPPPPPPPAAAQKPQPKPPAQQVSKEPLGVSRPPPEAKAEETKLEPKPEPQPEPKPEPKQEAAVAPPPESTPPPEKPLEKVLPPVEQPPAPLSMRDFVKVLPPPPPPPHPTAPRPPVQTPQHSPLSTAPPQSQASASAGPSSTFVNPAEADRQLRAKDAYLWQVIRKFSQYLPDLRGKNEGGTVVLRFVIARDGRLVEAGIAKSSGVPALDRGLLESLRAAAPYPPLPPEIPGAQVVFVQPIGAAR